MQRIRLGLIFGGRSGEHAVSLMSARSVMDALDHSKYDVTQIAILPEGGWLSGNDALGAMETGDLSGLVPVAILGEPGACILWRTEAGKALEALAELDVIFPIMHGTFGEDGTLQGLLELAEVAYVGAGVLSGALAMDKAVFKEVMRAIDILTPSYRLLNTSAIHADLEAAALEAEQAGEYPFFVKPANMGSSVGVMKVNSRADMVEGLMDAALYDRRVLVEQGINAHEIEVSVLGNEDPIASLPGEILPGEEFYSYDAKYNDETSRLLIPAPLDEEVTEQIRQTAVNAYKAIDGAGMARVDFLLERETGTLYLNEINSIPGFTKISMYPKLWEASGLLYSELLDRLVELAFERHEQKTRLMRHYEASA
jgi:D-alanine-D-alanine ligase